MLKKYQIALLIQGILRKNVPCLLSVLFQKATTNIIVWSRKFSMLFQEENLSYVED